MFFWSACEGITLPFPTAALTIGWLETALKASAGVGSSVSGGAIRQAVHRNGSNEKHLRQKRD